MRLLVTRPIDDAERLAQKLRLRGHEPIIAPLMTVRFHDGPPLVLDRVQAILATSANGVHAVARRSDRRDIAFFAVGPQTAETGRTIGFTEVVDADGDAAALVETVAAKLSPARGALFHAAGAETAGRLRQGLEARGFSVLSEILYDAEPVNTLPPPAAEALAANALDGILVFSPRSAVIFGRLVAAAGLQAHCARLDAYCISAATAAALAPIAFARVAVAGAPNQEAMLGLLPAANPVAGEGRSLL